MLAVFAALFLRLWALQVLSGTQYLRVAQDNQFRTVRVQAPRGLILDRNGRILVDERAGTAVAALAGRPAAQVVPRATRELKRLANGSLHVPINEMLKGIERAEGRPADAGDRPGARRAARWSTTSRSTRTSSAASRIARTRSCATTRTAPLAAQLLGYVSGSRSRS